MRRWVKLFTEILDDPKVAALSDHEFRAFVNLLALAGQVDRDGELGTLKEISYRLRMPPSKFQRILAGICRKGIKIVSDSAGNLIISAFSRRNPADASDAPGQVKNRVALHRAAKQALPEDSTSVTNPLRNGNVTNGVTPLEENRVEENRKETTPGAFAPVEKSDHKPPEEKRALTEKEQARAALEIEFCELTGLVLPARETDKQRKAAADRWWNPIDEIYRLADSNLPKAKLLIAKSIHRLDAQTLTYDSPASIVSSARYLSKKQVVRMNPAANNGRQLRGPHD